MDLLTRVSCARKGNKPKTTGFATNVLLQFFHCHQTSRRGPAGLAGDFHSLRKMHKFHKQRLIGCKVGFSGPIPRGLTSPCILLYYIEHSVFNQAVRGAPPQCQARV